VRVESSNNRTTGIDTNNSTMFTLLLELNLICEQRCLNCKIVPLRQNVGLRYHLANLWNQITTKIFDIFRIITLKQQKFSQSDPVLIRQLKKNCGPIQSWSGQNWLQSDPVLIRVHLWIPDLLFAKEPNLVQKRAKKEPISMKRGEIRPNHFSKFISSYKVMNP